MVLNGHVVKLGAAMLEKMKTEPNAQIGYHTINMKADPPGAFDLTLVVCLSVG